MGRNTEKVQIDPDNNTFYAKIALTFFIALFCILLAGQIIIRCYNTNNFEKTIGTIKTVVYKITSYTGGGTWRAGQPNYSVVISLSNGMTYNADLHDGTWLSNYELKKGDEVTVYYPSKVYNLLSLNFLNYGCNRISELYFRNQAFYKLNHSHDNFFIIYIIVAIIIFCRMLYKVSHK
jgi:hypothetical protein